MKSTMNAALAALLLALCGCALSLPLAVIPISPAAVDFPDAGAAILEDDATLEFRVMKVDGLSEPRLVAVLDHRRRMKVLREHGLAAAHVDFLLDGYSTIIDVVARSVSPTGSSSTMGRSGIEYFAPADPQERSPDVKIMRLNIPDAAVGGLIEYRYQRVYTDPSLVPPWVFGDTMPILHAEFGLVTSPELTVDYHYSDGEKPAEKAPLRRATGDGRERLVFIETDLPAFYNEPAMPPITHNAPWLAVSLRTARLGDKKLQRVRGWDDIAKVVLSRMEAVGGKKGSGTLLARYNAVRKNIRPLALLGLGLRIPQPAASLLKGAPACSRDATALLLQSFVGADVAAYPALLTGWNGPPLAIDFPAMYPFTNAAVAVEVTHDMLAHAQCGGDIFARDVLCGRKVGDLAFLDPLCRHCAFGVLPTDAGGGRALLIEAEGSTRWVDLPIEPPERHSAHTRITYTLDVDGSFTGNLIADARGTVAQRLRDALSTSDQDEDHARFLSETLLGENPGPRPGGFTMSNANDTEVPLGVKMTLSGKLERADYEHFRVRAIDLVGSSILEFWRGARHSAARLAGPRWQETTVEMALPVGYVAELSPPIRIANALAEYAGGFAIRGQTLVYSRRLVIKVPVITPNDWPAFIDLVEQIRDAEASNQKVRSNE